jgi:hypothetical protein
MGLQLGLKRTVFGVKGWARLTTPDRDTVFSIILLVLSLSQKFIHFGGL